MNKNGRSFKKYSKAYRKLKGSSDVDLRLSGDMLDSMEVDEVTRHTITVAFDDQLSNDKAHGHINGGNNLPVRDFFGLPVGELSRIVKKVAGDNDGN